VICEVLYSRAVTSPVSSDLVKCQKSSVGGLSDISPVSSDLVKGVVTAHSDYRKTRVLLVFKFQDQCGDWTECSYLGIKKDLYFSELTLEFPKLLLGYF